MTHSQALKKRNRTRQVDRLKSYLRRMQERGFNVLCSVSMPCSSMVYVSGFNALGLINNQLTEAELRQCCKDVSNMETVYDIDELMLMHKAQLATAIKEKQILENKVNKISH